MKLNKVLALALSGVMAVSMLAGCSGNPGNGGQEGEGEKPPVVTTDAADVLNKIQGVVKFDDDATLNGYMAPVETLKPSVVEKLSKNDSVAALDKDSDAAVKAIRAKMVKEDADQVADEFNFSNKSKNNTKTDDVTETVFYAVNADKVISIEHLMTELSSELNTDEFKTQVSITGTDKGNYVASYTGAVSVKKATGTDEDGKTYNAYVVAVSITRTLGDKLVG